MLDVADNRPQRAPQDRLALAQQLPCDILYLIFTCILPAVFKNTEVQDVRKLPPFNLSLVCRSWRAAVDSHPSLWSSLTVFYDSSLLPHYSRPIPFLIKHWLDRSASTRLSLSIYVYNKGPASDSVFTEIHALVTSQQHRWDVVFISIESHHTETTVIPCPPSLSYLAVNIEGVRFMRRSRTPIVLDLSCFDAVSVMSSSRLHTLTTGQDVEWRLPLQENAVHFPNLQTLDISINPGLLIGDVLAVLRGCPRLLTLYLEVQGTPLNHRNESGGESIVHLPIITSLLIRSRNQVAARHFLDHISCPKLVSFKYRSIPSITEPEEECESVITLAHIHGFIRFFSRLCAASDRLPLRTFKLYFLSTFNTVEYSGETLQQFFIAVRELFDMLGNLEVLGWAGVLINDTLLKILTITDKVKVLCPSLKKIWLRHNRQSEFVLHWEAIEDMVVSRWSAEKESTARRTRRLRFFSISDSKLDVPDEKCGRLRKCVKEGLSLFHNNSKINSGEE